MSVTNRLPEMTPVIMEHEQLLLIGIPCIGLNDMGGKYHHAKDALLALAPSLQNSLTESPRF